MKTSTILATVLMLSICTSAMAISIIVTGQVLSDGDPLQVVPGSWGPLFDFENLGVNPLVELYINSPYNLVAQTTVGAGQFGEPVDGFFSKTVDVHLSPGDFMAVLAYVTPYQSFPYMWSSQIARAQPSDSIYDFGEIDILLVPPPNIPWPEPSILLTGLVLFLIRRKK